MTKPCTVLRALLAVTALVILPSAAAALPADQAACRDAIAKAMTGYAKTSGQLIAACHKERSAGSRPLSTDCNDVASADVDGRLAAARARVQSSITGACGSSSALLAEYGSCPAPAEAADDGGATTGLDSFAELADCLIDLSDAELGAMSAQTQGEPDAVLDDAPAKCQATMAKLTATIIKTYAKEGRKCQKNLDPSASEAEFGCNLDSNAKIGKARSKFDSKFSACTLPSSRIQALNACGDDFASYRECARDAAEEAALALIRNPYELEDDGTTPTTTSTLEPTTTTDAPTTTTVGPTTTTTLDVGGCGDSAPTCDGTCPSGQICQNVAGECSCVIDGAGACAPATVRRIIHGKYAPSQTSLSTGWSGSAHDVDIPDQTTDVVDVVCDSNCQSCDVSLNVQEGSPASNCRCASDSTQTCTTINGSDPACSGLDTTCRCYFGAPLAISAGGTPVCVVNRITEDYTGTMNLRTGEWDVRIKLASVVHLGIDSVSPCPTCEGDDVYNDGVRNGTCAGGLSSNACDTNGEHLTFGPTSWDCMPNSAVNISGNGLLLDLRTTSESQTMESNVPCDSPAGTNCPCRVCSGNSNVGCNSDADCAAAGAGACTAGGGAGVQPNQCDGFTCTAEGRCATGPVDMYCDGVTHPDGRGFISCNTDVDCSANGQGTCSVFDLRRCYTDPITSQGSADPLTPVTTSIFCIPPTTSPAVNLTGGIPGPGILTLDFDADVRCRSNPELAYEFPSGANCGGGTTTTSTTLLPPLDCESASAPTCGGTCDGAQVCTDNGGVCECQDPPLPACGDAVSPLCAGTCPAGQICLDSGGTCGCTLLPLP